jgi:hypothetical protein
MTSVAFTQSHVYVEHWAIQPQGAYEELWGRKSENLLDSKADNKVTSRKFDLNWRYAAWANLAHGSHVVHAQSVFSFGPSIRSMLTRITTSTSTDPSCDLVPEPSGHLRSSPVVMVLTTNLH